MGTYIIDYSILLHLMVAQHELVMWCNVKGPEDNDKEAGNISSMFAPLQLEAPSGVYKMPVTPTTQPHTHTHTQCGPPHLMWSS